MLFEIISIGTELLLGRIVNTNAAYLSEKLAEMGADLYHQNTVGDNPERIAESVRRALGRSDAVILTGGLGPTVDDVTIDTVAKLCGKMEGAKRLPNSVGTAAGLILDCSGKPIICLPGPPRELIPMFDKDVMPYLRRRFGAQGALISYIIRTTGIAESRVNHKVKDLLKLKPPVTVGIYAKLGEVDLVITAKARSASIAAAMIRPIEAKILRRLGGYVFGHGDQTLEAAAGRVLVSNRKTIAVAESCTGGLISSRLTDVSGSSRYFLMGLVAYSNRIKEDVLGVSAKLLDKHGAASKAVALKMASGIRLLAGADIGIGVTGIAGPTGGTEGAPVGLVYIAFADRANTLARMFRFKGSRQEIKFQFSQAALDMIRRGV